MFSNCKRDRSWESTLSVLIFPTGSHVPSPTFAKTAAARHLSRKCSGKDLLVFFWIISYTIWSRVYIYNIIAGCNSTFHLIGELQPTKKIMASAGYTVKLPPGTRVPDSYYCPLCKLLLRNAVQTSEGDRLCEECFKSIAKYGDNMHARHLRLVHSDCD